MKYKKIRLTIYLLLLATYHFSFASQDEWRSYLDGSVGKNSYYLYQQVMLKSFVDNKNHRALDLGAGAGDIDIDLAGRGWDVTSVDNSPRSGEIISERMKYIHGKFNFQLSDFEHTKLQGNYDLILSFFSLPFGNKNNLPIVIKRISQHTHTNAVFAATFFGNEHTFVINAQAFGITKDEIYSLLETNEFQIKFFLNRKYTQTGLNGEVVNWDVLDVIAEKL